VSYVALVVELVGIDLRRCEWALRRRSGETRVWRGWCGRHGDRPI